MDVLQPRSLAEALEMRAARPEALPIAGGTDVMVELNFDRIRPEALLDLGRVVELQTWRREDGELFLGAGMTYARMLHELPEVRTLAEASRSVGSPQIRNRGTLGGNLGTASPAGDAIPVLAAHDATIELASASGTRAVGWSDFLLGPKRSTLGLDELILGARFRPATGPGSFSKVGTRNAMVIAIASLCLVMDPERRGIRVALGSVGPTVLRASDAEASAVDALERAGTWDEPAAPVPPEALAAFADLVADAARPIDDVRGTATYRRHACRVLARRALAWALTDWATEAMVA